jgi:hypothetical protein
MGQVQRGLPDDGEIFVRNIFLFVGLFEHLSRTQKSRRLRWCGSAFGTTKIVRAFSLSTDALVLILRYACTVKSPQAEPDDIDAQHHLSHAQ